VNNTDVEAPNTGCNPKTCPSNLIGWLERCSRINKDVVTCFTW